MNDFSTNSKPLRKGEIPKNKKKWKVESKDKFIYIFKIPVKINIINQERDKIPGFYLVKVGIVRAGYKALGRRLITHRSSWHKQNVLLSIPYNMESITDKSLTDKYHDFCSIFYVPKVSNTSLADKERFINSFIGLPFPSETIIKLYGKDVTASEFILMEKSLFNKMRKFYLQKTKKVFMKLNDIDQFTTGLMQIKKANVVIENEWIDTYVRYFAKLPNNIVVKPTINELKMNKLSRDKNISNNDKNNVNEENNTIIKYNVLNLVKDDYDPNKEDDINIIPNNNSINDSKISEEEIIERIRVQIDKEKIYKDTVALVDDYKSLLSELKDDISNITLSNLDNISSSSNSDNYGDSLHNLYEDNISKKSSDDYCNKESKSLIVDKNGIIEKISNLSLSENDHKDPLIKIVDDNKNSDLEENIIDMSINNFEHKSFIENEKIILDTIKEIKKSFIPSIKNLELFDDLSINNIKNYDISNSLENEEKEINEDIDYSIILYFVFGYILILLFQYTVNIFFNI